MKTSSASDRNRWMIYTIGKKSEREGEKERARERVKSAPDFERALVIARDRDCASLGGERRKRDPSIAFHGSK